MYIIADIEWVQNKENKQSPTQLSAVRVDNEWNIKDEFSSYIRPMDASFHDWKHVAYAGGKPDDFLYHETVIMYLLLSIIGLERIRSVGGISHPVIYTHL